MSVASSELEALLTLPALAALEGATTNFSDPPNRNGLAWLVTSLCMVVATISVVIRAYAKIQIFKKIHVEEILMLCAYGAYCCTAYAGYGMISASGYYVHQWNLRNGDLIEPFYLILVYGCAYSATLALVKTAILLDWCRIFVAGKSHKTYFWWISMFIALVQLVWGILCIILLNIASISATVRLSTTITFAHEDDKMYFIAPLLFWTCAEMTCGFFILGVSCIPSIVKNSELREKIRSILSPRAKSSNSQSNVHHKNYPHASSLSTHKVSKSGANHGCYTLDEEEGALPLVDMPSKREEHRIGVKRTTHSVVTSDPRTSKTYKEFNNGATQSWRT